MHDLFSQLFLCNVAFVAIPYPLVDLADREVKAVGQSFCAFFWERGVLVPLANQNLLLIDGFRLVIAFLLF